MSLKSVLKWPLTQHALKLVAIVITIAIFLYQLHTSSYKSVTCRVVAKRPLVVRGPDKAANDLSISFNGTQVNDPWTMTIAIVNTGNLPIQKDDFEEPISVTIDKTQILTSGISNLEPPNINASVTHHENELAISNGLLNPNDEIEVSLITDGEPTELSVRGRITGVHEPTLEERLEESSPKRSVLANIGNFVALVGLAFVTLIVGVFVVGVPLSFFGWLRSDWHPRPKSLLHIDRDLLKAISNHSVQPRDDVLGVTSELRCCPPVNWLDSPEQLRTFLAERREARRYRRLGQSVEDVETKIKAAIKLDLKRIATEACSDPRFSVWSTEMKDRLQSIEFESTNELRRKIRQLCRENPPSPDEATSIFAVILGGLPKGLGIVAALCFSAFIVTSLWYSYLGY